MDSKTVSVALKGVTKAVEKHFESKKEEARLDMFFTQPSLWRLEITQT